MFSHGPTIIPYIATIQALDVVMHILQRPRRRPYDNRLQKDDLIAFCN